ncbi:HEAT repeat domain-containing protein [Photobacterium swingsii]|uniref:HEAT repeat domain-containing protein n=2 Tax=Photobacterium swingsii TaxID=680026 RepID=UPI00352D346C
MIKLNTSLLLLVLLFSFGARTEDSNERLVVQIPDLSFCLNKKGHYYDSDECLKLIYGFNNDLNHYWGNSDDKKDAILLFHEMWENKFNEEIYTLPIVKLNLVYLLGQAKWFDYDVVPNDELRTYALLQLASQDLMTVSAAISALSIVGEAQDTDILREIVLTERKGVSEKSLSAIVMLLKHHNKVSPFMVELLPHIKRGSLRTIIKSYI